MRKKDNLKNESYWVTIEPYVFIFKGKQEYILYNILSGDLINLNVVGEAEIIELLDKLENIDNLYSAEITEIQFKNSKFQKFITSLRDGFFGDIIPKSLFGTKPVTIPPIINVQNSIKNIEENVELQKHDTYIGFLHEITVYLNGVCESNCRFCEKYHNQFIFCTKSNDSFTKQDIDNLFGAIQQSKISKINLTGGDVLSYKYLNYVIEKFNTLNVELSIFSHYKNDLTSQVLEIFQNTNIQVHLLISFDEFDNDKLQILLSKCRSYDNIVYDFVCQQEDEYNNILNIIESFEIISYNIYPFYQDNIDFFKTYVFSTRDEIIENKLSTKDIFIRKSLNFFDYGKFIITSNKNIYSNLNYSPIGQLKENNLVELTKNELTPQSPWFRTRDKLNICGDCAYCFLCPSPSNYELIIGKNNLCNILH